MGAPRFPSWLVPLLAILAIAPAGYWGGPELVAGILIGAAVIVGVIVFATQWHSAPSRPPQKQAAPTARPTHEPPPELGRWIAGAIALRLVGAVVFNLTKFNRAVAPDSDGYAYYGRMIATSWKNPAFSLEGVVGYNPRSFYQHLNGVIYYIADVNPSIPLSFINAFVGVLAAWLISRLAYQLYGAVAARRAFLLAAFYPSIVLWTSINLRDAWSLALLAGSLLAAQGLREKFSTSRLAVLLLLFAIMPFVRGYLVPIVGLGIASSYLIVRVRRLPAALASLAGLGVFLVLLADQLGVRLALDVDDHLEAMERMRDGLAYGRSAFDTSIRINTPTGALLYLPIGVVNFLFSPLPWRISSWRQIMALPESGLTLWMLYLAGKEMLASARDRLSEVATLLFVTVAITCAYGLVEGNEGTAYRHRAHTLILFAVFAAGAKARLGYSPRQQGALTIPQVVPGLRPTQVR